MKLLCAVASHFQVLLNSLQSWKSFKRDSYHCPAITLFPELNLWGEKKEREREKVMTVVMPTKEIEMSFCEI